MFFVRTASERDLPKVSALLAETWHATYDALYGPDKVSEITAKWHSVPALTEKLKRKHAEFVVADDGRVLAGMGYAALSEADPKVAVLHQLYGLEQAAAAHVAYVMVVAEALLETAPEVGALCFHLGKQVVAANDALHGERPCARHRMAEVGMAVLKEARALCEGLVDLL